jgi:hypothetical protein
MNETTKDTASDATNGATNGAAHGTAPELPKADVKPLNKAARKALARQVQDLHRVALETPKAEAPKVEAPQPEAPKVEAVEAQPNAGLRLRIKVWTDPKTRKRYLMATGIMFEKEAPLGILTAYAMSDEDTKIIKMTPPEWNALPFFYFQEDGPAPRAAVRPVDVIRR